MGDVAAMGVLRADIGRPGASWPRPRGARRCLFGPPDPEKTRTFLESETKRLDAESRRKWNFDFVQEKPIQCGRYTWMQASESEEGNVKEDLQTKITDFMRKRKLPTNPKESTSSTDEPRTKTRRRFST